VTTAPQVIGLDLSITATGIADIDGMTSTVGGKASRGDARLIDICLAVLAEKAIGCQLAVIEGLAVHGPGGAMAAAQVMGAVKITLMQAQVRYVEVPPSSLKKYATGKGNATKADMAVALYKRAGLELADDNQVDAWWLRAMGLDALGSPIVDMPGTCRDAIHRIEWPTLGRTLPSA
jgi:hypothetical protein